MAARGHRKWNNTGWRSSRNIHVCMYVCMYTRTHTSTHARTHACTHIQDYSHCQCLQTPQPFRRHSSRAVFRNESSRTHECPQGAIESGVILGGVRHGIYMCVHTHEISHFQCLQTPQPFRRHSSNESGNESSKKHKCQKGPSKEEYYWVEIVTEYMCVYVRTYTHEISHFQCLQTPQPVRRRSSRAASGSLRSRPPSRSVPASRPVSVSGPRTSAAPSTV